MNPNRSIFITFLLIALSLGFGYNNYIETKQSVVSDLNQALQHSVMQNMDIWLNQDSIHTYAQLQEIMGAPVSVSSPNHKFAEALNMPKLKKISGIYFHILKKDEQMPAVIPDGYLTSDTLLWISPNGEASSDLTLSFQGYARCSAGMILSLSNQTLPASLLFVALLWGMGSCLYIRKRKPDSSPIAEEKELISFGNLTLSCEENCFYNKQQEKLKLTPLQYALMEMFYLSSSHKLLKTDICQSLWPGKENADETLYTLIRRLKPIVEEHSNLKIATDRGRAYALEIKS